MDSQKRRTREDPVEPFAKKRLDRSYAERPDPDALDPVGTERHLELGRDDALCNAAREQDARRRLEPPERERERALRGAIEPLDIVDGDEGRLVGREYLERASNGDAEGARIDRRRRLLDQKRDLEGSPSRRRQLREHVLERRLEEIAEPCKRQPALGFGGTGRENTKRSCACRVDRCAPERRLPDARLALEHDRARHRELRRTEKPVQPLELCLASDDLACHRRNDGGKRPWRQALGR